MKTSLTRNYERRILKKYLSRYFKAKSRQDILPVSYTHLTLPTIVGV